MRNNSYKDRKQQMEDPLQPREKESKFDKWPIGIFFVVLLGIFVFYGITSMIFNYELLYMEELFQWITNDFFQRGGDLEL